VNAGSGDDIVSFHPGSVFHCYGDTYIGAFDTSVYDFWSRVVGGDGADELYGSDNSDDMASNTYTANPSGDGDIDILCGYGDGDWLSGDGDDSSTNYECLNGSGDTCDGKDGSGTEYDWWFGCTTHSNAAQATIFNSGYGQCIVMCPASPPDFAPYP
jgi:hypothetical protein